MSGSGLMPPVFSSVDPIGIPRRPTADPEPSVGEDADPVGLEDAMPLIHVPDAVPAMPAPSNSGVGADVPDTAPIAEDSPLIGVPVPTVELPNPDVPVCIDPSVPEHAVAVVIEPVDIEPRGEMLEVVGLTPGVASSVAPSGIPVAATGAPGPMPSGEVMPIGGARPVPTAVWADAVPNPETDNTNAIVTACFIVISKFERCRDYAASRSGGAMNSGPTGSLMVCSRI
jgi:hypothetical protein